MFPLRQVGRTDTHRGTERSFIPNKGQPGIVGDVEPFVSVGRPGVGGGKITHQMRQFRTRRSPQAKGPIHMYPRAGLVSFLNDFGSSVKRPGVDVAGLQANDGGGTQLGKQLSPHPALTVHRNLDNPFAAQAQHT